MVDRQFALQAHAHTHEAVAAPPTHRKLTPTPPKKKTPNGIDDGDEDEEMTVFAARSEEAAARLLAACRSFNCLQERWVTHNVWWKQTFNLLSTGSRVSAAFRNQLA